jgi:hypothetical protein
MGEVYRAVDTALGREVAIKILPPLLAGDPERIARFDREARLLAALNHPNIAILYGFERHEKAPFLVMELVEGETLAERLAQGRLPLAECLEILQQVAEGLEAAHEGGVIHRDLKPANIKITPDGKAKLLDFGLAKALEGERGLISDASLSPTLTAAATRRGEVMGTASYMSPEQARGKPVDRRTDIWAFGCVLYECLTGRLAYGGETISDTIALILQREPDWQGLPTDTPPRLIELLRRCLEKDARRRLRDIGEARIEIEKGRAGSHAPLGMGVGGSAAGATTGSWGAVAGAAGGSQVRGASGPLAAGRRFGAGALAAAVLAGLALGSLAWVLVVLVSGTAVWGVARDADGSRMIRFSILPPAGLEMEGPRISPDGSVLVFSGVEAASGPDGRRERALYVRPLDSPVARRIEGSEGAFVGTFSPDGRWLAFAAPMRPGSPTSSLRKVPVDGSTPPVVLVDWNSQWQVEVLWLEDGDLLVSTRDNELLRIPSHGGGRLGAPVKLVPHGPDNTEAGLPSGGELVGLLPDPGKVLMSFESWEGRYHQEAHILDTRTGALRRILDDASSPVWSPTGHLVFTRHDTLRAVPFDPESLEPVGGFVSLAKGLGLEDAFGAGAEFSLSRNGTLVHVPGGRPAGQRALVIVGQDGKASPWSDDRRAFQPHLRLSGDRRRLATTIMTEDLLFSVWVSEVERPRLRATASMPGMDCSNPIWMPDGEKLLFRCAGREGKEGLYSMRADGGDRPSLLVDLESHPLDLMGASLTPDGRWLLTDRAYLAPMQENFLYLADLSAAEPSLRPFLPDLPVASTGRFSPDGRWVCYLAPTSRGTELYVRRFNGEAGPGPPILAAVGEIVQATWRATQAPGVLDLVYIDSQAREYQVAIDTRQAVHVSNPRLSRDLSGVKPALATWDYLPDGRLLAVQRGADEDEPTRAEVTVNWFEELNRLVPAGR